MDFILPPKEIDLSQTLEGPSRPDPVDTIKGILNDLSREQMSVVQKAFEQQAAQFNAKIDGLVVNINASLNDFQRQLDAQREQHYYVETVIDSLLKLQLLGDKMPADVAAKHKEVVALFLRNNAVITVAAEQEQTVTH
jgi:hypothetical protein